MAGRSSGCEKSSSGARQVQFRFADCLLDVGRRELTRGSQPIAVGPQVFDLLAYLVQNRERVVSKDDLFEAIWQGRVVSESTLTTHINAVRKAVGDSGEDQRLIRTIARKGFRFVGDVGTLSRPDRAEKVNAQLASAASALTLPDKPSIAVLPFQNLSGDPEQEYFAVGMVEEITTALSRFKWLFVIARNSSFTYKGKAVNVKQVGRQLGVRYVLEGSVRKAAGKVRITGQLIDAITGANIWADSFERDLTDVFALQDEVTVAVVSAVQPKLLQTEIALATRRRPENLTAYDFYLRALPQFYLATREGVAETLRLVHRALELEPRFGLVAALAGVCHQLNLTLGHANDPQFERKEAARLLRLALSLDDNDPDILAWASGVHGRRQ